MLLLARHEEQEEITFAQMAREYFELEPDALERKIKKGVVDFKFFTGRRNSIRTSKIPLPQLAQYIEQQRAAAITRMDDYTRNI